ncbi:hypothetical protein [Oceanobacillus limi]|nr:hypothetical protein [Oceanobacillus limi]
MIKHKIIVSLISIAFLFFITYGVYSAEYNLQIDKKLLANDYQLYQQVEDTVKNNTEMTDNWRITGVDLEAESEYPIRIRLSIDKGSDLVRFSINEQFSISHVLSQNKNLEFEQYRNVVEIATNGVQSLTIYYEETLGTSFFPITSNVIYLPAESNWYPQYKNLKQYTVDSIGNFHSNVETNSCKRNEIVFGQSNYSWQGNNPNCLSIIKGPYERLEIHDTDLVIYQPFTTKRSNYVELKEHLLVVQNELCQLFYSSKDKLNCSVDPHSIVITPKSIGTDAFSLYDSTTHNGQYTFYVNPFLDVNDRPVTTHLMELSTFLIPYRLLEDEKLSILVSQYLNEKLDIETTGYINWVRDSSSITSEEWDDFSGLSIGDKEKILKHMFSEPRSGG